MEPGQTFPSQSKGNPMAYVTCVVCRRDPRPGGSYTRYGNRAMVCKFCRSHAKAVIKKMEDDD